MLTKTQKIEVLKQFQKKFDEHVTFFKSDFCHDAITIAENPEGQYIYFLREAGSDLARLVPGQPLGEIDQIFILSLMNSSKFLYFWDGSTMETISAKDVLDKVKQVGTYVS